MRQQHRWLTRIKSSEHSPTSAMKHHLPCVAIRLYVMQHLLPGPCCSTLLTAAGLAMCPRPIPVPTHGQWYS